MNTTVSDTDGYYGDEDIDMEEIDLSFLDDNV